ncbi:MAG: nucleotidyltransferase domain-containing protein [Chloroflexota bacterium]
MKVFRPRVRALKLAREFRKRLANELGQPVKVIMFGSQARGDAIRESDIDLLVILPSLDSAMMDLAFGVAWEVGLEAGKVLSVVPAEENELERLEASPFYRAVKREGVVVE